MTHQRPAGPPTTTSSSRIEHDAFADRPAAIAELMRWTDIIPKTLAERAEIAMGINSRLGSMFRLSISEGEDEE